MKISKYPIIFASLLATLVGLFSFVSVKYYPFLFKKLIYHCQHLDCSRLVRLSTEIGVTVFQLMIVFIALTFIKLVINYVQVFSLRRKIIKTIVKRNQIEPLIKSLGLSGKVVVVDNQKPFAFCLGFIKPKIVLSSTLIKIMNRRELGAILNHEKYHLEHKDAVVSLLAKIVQSLFPFLLLISDFVKLYNTERETKADEQAIRTVDGRISLISALKKLLKFDNPPAFSTIPAFTGMETLEARIRSLTQNVSKLRFLTLKSISISIFSFIILLGLFFAPLHTFAQGKNGIVTCVSTASCTDTCLQTSDKSPFISSH